MAAAGSWRYGKIPMFAWHSTIVPCVPRSPVLVLLGLWYLSAMASAYIMAGHRQPWQDVTCQYWYSRRHPKLNILRYVIPHQDSPVDLGQTSADPDGSWEWSFAWNLCLGCLQYWDSGATFPEGRSLPAEALCDMFSYTREIVRSLFGISR